MVKVFFPPPNWLANTEYARLPCRGEDGEIIREAYFSLNIAIYGQDVITAEWEDQWFLLAGRFHPFALTWTIDPDTEIPGDEPMDFTVPILIVRDGGYQP